MVFYLIFRWMTVLHGLSRKFAFLPGERATLISAQHLLNSSLWRSLICMPGRMGNCDSLACLQYLDISSTARTTGTSEKNQWKVNMHQVLICTSHKLFPLLQAGLLSCCQSSFFPVHETLFILQLTSWWQDRRQSQSQTTRYRLVVGQFVFRRCF